MVTSVLYPPVSGIVAYEYTRRKLLDSTVDAISMFGRLSSGGRVVEGTSYPGRLVQLGDKTMVGLRGASNSGGLTIDIKLAGGERWKVRIR